MSAKARLQVLTMGGTIATGLSGDGAILNASALLGSAPSISSFADVNGKDILTKTSSSLTLDDFQLILSAVENALLDADGVVITHGTDTLEESAFLLSRVLSSVKPVVLTGSLRRAGAEGADGPANLSDACRVAADPESLGKGVLVVLNNEIHSGSSVQKSHSFLPSAFTSLGPLGWVAEDRVRFLLSPIHPAFPLKLGPMRPSVPLIEVGTSFDEKIIAALSHEHFDGLVINATGVGHVSDECVQSLAAFARKRPLLFASRTGGGETFQNTYTAKGAERELQKSGLIPTGFLTGRQARLALMLLLSAGSELDTIRKYFGYFSD